MNPPDPALRSFGSDITARALVTGLMVSFATGLAQTLSFATTFVFAAFLAPSALGLVRLIQIAATYANFGHLGTLSAMGREVPIARGAMAPDAVRHVRDSAWTTGFVLVGTLSLFLLVAIGLAPSNRIEGLDAWTLGLSAVLVPVWYCWEFNKNWLSASGLFRVRGWVELSFGVALVGCAFLLVPAWGLPGAIGAFIVSRMAGIGVAAAAAGWPFFPRFDARESWRLIRVGLPITGNSFVRYVFTTVDSLVAAAFLGTHELGYYVIASIGFSALEVLPSSLAVILGTRMAETRGRFGLEAAKAHIAWQVERPTVLLCETTLILGTILLFAGPMLVRTWLPDYVPGIRAFQVLAATHCFVTLRLLSGAALNVIDRQGTFLRLQILGVLVSLALSSAVLAAGFGLAGLAIASSSVSAATGLLLMFFSLRHIYGETPPASQYCVRLGGALLAGLALLGTAGALVGFQSWSSSLAAAASCAFGILVLFALVFRGESLLAVGAMVWSRHAAPAAVKS